MRKVTIYSFIAALFTLLVGCSVKLQTYDLSEEYAASLHYEGSESGTTKAEEEGEKSTLVGIPARSYYGGDLKRGAIWWAGKGITLEKGEVFIFEATNVGPDTIPFGATFPPIDLLIEKVIIKISARVESDTLPTLFMQVDDADGYQANIKWPSNKIEKSEGFKDYYFDTKDIFTQTFPKKHKVSGAMINSLKFFINPGLEGYSGKIYIKEIKVLPAPSEK